MNTRWPKIGAMVSVAIWLVALLLPAFLNVQVAVHGIVDDTTDVSTTFGWEVLLSGWAGPLSVLSFCYGDFCGSPPTGYWSLLPPLGVGAFSFAAFSWYANIFWALAVTVVGRGLRPHPVIVFAAAGLAVLALQPAVQYFNAVWTDVVPAYGAYVWAFAIGLPAIFWPFIRKLPTRTATQPSQSVA